MAGSRSQRAQRRGGGHLVATSRRIWRHATERLRRLLLLRVRGKFVITKHCCSSGTRNLGTGRGSASPSRRGSTFRGWLVSGTLFVLVPKCPACLAANIGLASGIGISFTTASYLRALILTLSATS